MHLTIEMQCINRTLRKLKINLQIKIIVTYTVEFINNFMVQCDPWPNGSLYTILSEILSGIEDELWEITQEKKEQESPVCRDDLWLWCSLDHLLMVDWMCCGRFAPDIYSLVHHLILLSASQHNTRGSFLTFNIKSFAASCVRVRCGMLSSSIGGCNW